ncbi:MAG TPA: HAD-IC family P-type ATPase [Acidimicrobiia bacterium]|nr:HAD-IC family P-type ATPase [Acidimicrobiia bacterium]
MTASAPPESGAPATHETPPTGLTTNEVEDRVARGLTNRSGEKTSRSYAEIFRANVFTRFNAILGTMFAVVLFVGQPQDGLFGLVLVANSLIGIVQEVRAKRTLDALAVLNAPRARVTRDGETREIAVDDLVLDDLCELRTGDQVPADGVVRRADGLEIDESLLTGESDPIEKPPGSRVLSGAIVVAGAGAFQATAVGADAYARQLAAQARQFQPVRSELQDGINFLLRLIQYALFPVSALLLWQQLRTDSVSGALTSTVAGVVGMVPEGLVLLTSLAFGIAAVTLARRQVLVQELPAVEVLARVDVVCLDKTGTLTEGDVVFNRAEPLGGQPDGDVRAALGALADDPNRNATLAAIGAAMAPPDGWTRRASTPFSSARKWSAATFADHGTWVLGAPEMVMPDAGADDPVRTKANELASQGVRVLVLAHSPATLDGEALPTPLDAAALVVLEEKIRPDAADTLAYFAAQGVALKVISGDNPRTVGAVAARVGLPGADAPVDARELPEDPAQLADVLESHTVFGRVTPQQKRAFVHALQSRGHVVAMTGDGVNDALALKDADIGVAMGSGAAATRAVAKLVLLDSRFATLPGVVAEGRRVIANIERSANLFVTKTVYAVVIAVIVVLADWKYLFLPRHLTIISDFTIGVPGFFLALAPNTRRYIPGFIRRVLRFCVPAGLVVGGAALIAYGVAMYGNHQTLSESRTTATLVVAVIALWVLVVFARPINWWRGLLVAAMVVAVASIVAVPSFRTFFALALPSGEVLWQAALISAVGAVLVELIWRVTRLLERTAVKAAPPPVEGAAARR